MGEDGQRRPPTVRRDEARPSGVRRGSGHDRDDWRDIPSGEFSFTERSALEHGFAEVYRERIVPVLRRHETQRTAMRAQAVKWIGIAALAGAAGAAAGIMLGWGNATLLAPFLAVVAGFIAYSYYQKKWSSGLSSEVIPVICEFLGGMEHGGRRLSPAEFEDLGVVPYHTGARLDDTVNGRHNGLGYTLTEARLTTRTRSSKGRTRTRTVFRGLMIRIDLLENVPGIYFARDRGDMFNWLSEAFSAPRQGREKIETPFPEFEALYETYTDDPEGARGFITPRLTSGLLEIAHGETGRERYIAAATSGRGFYLAIPRRGDFLSLGSLFRPLTVAEDDIHQCLADLALPRRVIEALGGG